MVLRRTKTKENTHVSRYRKITQTHSIHFHDNRSSQPFPAGVPRVCSNWFYTIIKKMMLYWGLRWVEHHISHHGLPRAWASSNRSKIARCAPSCCLISQVASAWLGGSVECPEAHPTTSSIASRRHRRHTSVVLSAESAIGSQNRSEDSYRMPLVYSSHSKHINIGFDPWG